MNDSFVNLTDFSRGNEEVSRSAKKGGWKRCERAGGSIFSVFEVKYREGEKKRELEQGELLLGVVACVRT